MHQFQPFHHAFFNNVGLNLQAIFNLDQLPPEIIAKLDGSSEKYRQLILIGHGGKALWESLKASGIQSDNPVDDFSIQILAQYFADNFPNNCYEIIYPGANSIELQSLGKLAGWHHSSPFKVGINEEWGTWYAYRAVVLADTCFEASLAVESVSPCKGCQHKTCIVHCPASALEGEMFDFRKCVGYRKQSTSKCKDTCLARVSCPVARVHRYSDEQIRYHYSISLKAIKQEY